MEFASFSIDRSMMTEDSPTPPFLAPKIECICHIALSKPFSILLKIMLSPVQGHKMLYCLEGVLLLLLLNFGALYARHAVHGSERENLDQVKPSLQFHPGLCIRLNLHLLIRISYPRISLTILALLEGYLISVKCCSGGTQAS